MALNVVPLLFVALPFVLTMDAMYDLYQDFALPSDRRGWGLTDDTAKENRIKRAHIKYFKGVLAHQAKSFATWKKSEKGKAWVTTQNRRRTSAEKTSNDPTKSRVDRDTANNELRELKSDLTQKYGVGVEQWANDGEDGRKGEPFLNFASLLSFEGPREKGDQEQISVSIQALLQEQDNYNELNVLLKRMNQPIKAEERQVFSDESIRIAVRGLNQLQNMIEKRAGDHSGVFKWVVYNEDPVRGEHNMFAWNYPTLLLAGVLINMLGEYYAKFSPVVSGPQAKNLCDILDSVLIVHVAIVGIQLIASLYFNLNANKNPNARNPSLDLMDIHNHPEDFASSVLIGLFNHLGTAVLVHTFVRASFGHSLRRSGVSMSSFSRGSRRSRRSSRRRRR